MPNGWCYLAAYIVLLNKYKTPLRTNAFHANTILLRHMTHKCFVYLSYKDKKNAPKVPESIKKWKNNWFFISLRNEKMDKNFLTV